MNPKLFIKSCEIANFVKRFYDPAKIWKDPVGWSQFHLMHGFASTVHAENGAIVALGVARMVEDPYDGWTAYEFSEDGKCLFIDLLISPGAMSAPMSTFTEIWKLRFGKPETVAYFRGLTPRLVVRNFDVFASKVRKKEGV